MKMLPRCLLPIMSFILATGCDKSEPQTSSPSPSAAPQATPASNAPVNQASDQKPKSSDPKWRAETSIYNFGTVWAGDLLTYPFRIYNDGGATLKILEAKPRCSCTIAENYSKEIPVGQTGVIPFKLDTRNKKGAVDEFLTIKTNDPQNPEMILHMKGMVRQLLETEVMSDSMAEKASDPKVALDKIKHSAGSFGTIRGTDRLQRVIKLKNTSGEPTLVLKLQHIQQVGNHFNADLQTIAPGQEYALTITGDPPFAGGPISAAVALETSIPGRPLYNVAIYAYVPGRIDVQPPKFVVDPEYPYVQERKVTITNYGTTPMTITGVAATDPSYKLSLAKPTEANPNQWVVYVTLPPAGYRPPAYGEHVRVETTDAEMKTIDIEVL
ncbi:MAG TPA: DUF1573 domain-containing protein, partial [Phycisphaerae bacterium]|nr:DUF1573 domain-containing protein [Phycisphaerae bacterium]